MDINIPQSKHMSSKTYTHIEKELSDVLYEIWQNKNHVDQKDIEQLRKFILKFYNHGQ